MSATWQPFLNDPDNPEFPPEPFVRPAKMARVQCRRAAGVFVADLVPHEAHAHTTEPADNATVAEEITGTRAAWCLGWPVAE